jgi:hypothetical protein
MGYDLVSKPLPGLQLDPSHPLVKVLAGYWAINEGAGSKVTDLSGNGNDGTLINMEPSTDWVGTERGYALDFDGTNDYVNIGDGAAVVGSGNFAISAWIKTSMTARGIFVNQRATDSTDGTYLLGVDDSPVGKIEFSIANTGIGFNFNSNASVNDGEWHHIVAQKVNTTGGEIYIDGRFDNSGTGSAKALLAVDVVIGRWNGDGLYFDGLIEDIRVFKRALSADEIHSIYATPYTWFKSSYPIPLFRPPIRFRTVLRSGYNMGGKIRILLRTKYNIVSKMTTVLKSKYSILRKFTFSLRSKYHVLRELNVVFELRYNVAPTQAEWRNVSDTIIHSFKESDLALGATSTEVILHLWNSKEDASNLTMTNCQLTTRLPNGLYTGGTDEEGQEAIDEKWFEVKSDGVTGADITDDAQASFTAIGGDPSVGGNALSIGDIKVNNARHIHVKVNVPGSPTTVFSTFPEFVIIADMV